MGWWDFAWSLFAKFGRYVITHNESANGEGVQQYPDWWVNSAEVGYTLWTVNGPFHGVPDPATPWLHSLASTTGRDSALSTFVSPMFLVTVSAAVGAIGFRMGVRRGLQQSKH